jgi:hypothetical protein
MLKYHKRLLTKVQDLEDNLEMMGIKNERLLESLSFSRHQENDPEA